MPKRFNSLFTMFVYLKGHHLLEYYFDVSDSRLAANEWTHNNRGEAFIAPREPRR